MSSFLDIVMAMSNVRKYDLLFACSLSLPLLAGLTGLLPWSVTMILLPCIIGGWVVLRSRIGKGA